MSNAGRPKESFIPWDNWYDDILSEYKEGASDVEIRALMLEKMDRETFSFDLWDRWLKEEEEFSETIKAGRLLSHAWWLKEGRINLKTIKDESGASVTFNYTGWYMNMKNRFGWSDKQEVETTGKMVYEIITPDDSNEDL